MHEEMGSGERWYLSHGAAYLGICLCPHMKSIYILTHRPQEPLSGCLKMSSIMSSDSDSTLLRVYTGAIIALTLHHLVFRRGEWHLKAPLLLTIWLASHPLLFVGELVMGTNTLIASASNTLLTLGSYAIFSIASMAVYRLFFHRLGSFPGPKMASVTKLWHAYKCLPGQNHLLLDDLHRQYGDYVRTGEYLFASIKQKT